MRRHQMGRPEPHGQRQFGPVHHRASSCRRLAAAVLTRVGVGPAGKEDRISTATFRAGKTVRPSTIHQQTDATLRVGEPCLKFDEGHLLRHGY